MVKHRPNSSVPRVSPARSAAFDILLRVEQEDSYASELLHASPAAQLSATDHGLATELVMGVLRWRSVLDSVIKSLSSSPIAKLDKEVLTALRLGSYQLLFWIVYLHVPLFTRVWTWLNVLASALRRLS